MTHYKISDAHPHKCKLIGLQTKNMQSFLSLLFICSWLLCSLAMAALISHWPVSMPSFTSFGKDCTESLAVWFYAKLLLLRDEIPKVVPNSPFLNSYLSTLLTGFWFSKIWGKRLLLTGAFRCKPSFMENIDLVFMFLNSKLELQVFVCGLKDLDRNAYPLFMTHIIWQSTSFGSNYSSCHEQFKSSPVT